MPDSSLRIEQHYHRLGARKAKARMVSPSSSSAFTSAPASMSAWTTAVSSPKYQRRWIFHGEPFRVVVDNVPKASMYVRERIWSEDQVMPKKDGGLTLEFSANSHIEVLNWLLSFGGEAVLKAPPDLQAELLERLKLMWGQYV